MAIKSHVAVKIRQELDRIAQLEGGKISPKIIVEAARDKSSILHSQFTWDDTEAAEQYRLAQAGQLIRTVNYTLTRVSVSPKLLDLTMSRLPDVPKSSVLAMLDTGPVVSPSINRGPGQSSYVPRSVAMADPIMGDSLLKDALRDLNSCRRKYSQLQKLARVWSALDDVMAEEERLGLRETA